MTVTLLQSVFTLAGGKIRLSSSLWQANESRTCAVGILVGGFQRCTFRVVANGEVWATGEQDICRCQKNMRLSRCYLWSLQVKRSVRSFGHFRDTLTALRLFVQRRITFFEFSFFFYNIFLCNQQILCAYQTQSVWIGERPDRIHRRRLGAPEFLQRNAVPQAAENGTREHSHPKKPSTRRCLALTHTTTGQTPHTTTYTQQPPVRLALSHK